MAACTCAVTYRERGSEHAVEVLAETAFEAVILALAKLNKNRYLKGPSRHATFEVKATRVQIHQVKVGEALDWLYATKPARTPEQKERQKYLLAVMAEDRH